MNTPQYRGTYHPPNPALASHSSLGNIPQRSGSVTIYDQSLYGRSETVGRSIYRPIGPWVTITTGDLNNFLKWLQDGRGVPCSPKTLARRITSLKSFFRWLREGGIVLADPAEKVVQKSVISPLPIVLSPEEQAKVLEAAQAYREKAKPDARPYTLLSLLFSTNIKKGECLAINTTPSGTGRPTALSIRALRQS